MRMVRFLGLTGTALVTAIVADPASAQQAPTSVDDWQTAYINSLQNTANTAAADIYALQLQNGAQQLDIFNVQVGVNEANQRIDVLGWSTADSLSALQIQNGQQQARIDVLQEDANTAAAGIYDLFLANGVQDLSIFNLVVRNNEQDALIAAANQNATNSAYIDINSTGGVAASAAGANAVAFGNGASAAYANSVALGSGSATTAANQVNVGGRTVSGVAPGVVASGSTDAVNGAQLSATNGRVANLESGLEAANSRMDAFEQLAIGVSGDIRRLDDKLKGATALAIAMSGNAFLPDKKVNITGNVGTYQGAWAGSIQVGAIVSPNAAMNAAVAKNFNKRGSFGARAGVTFGW